jgi:CheY-like chemotaxis protein
MEVDHLPVSLIVIGVGAAELIQAADDPATGRSQQTDAMPTGPARPAPSWLAHPCGDDRTDPAAHRRRPPVVRDGLRAVLATQPDLQVVGEADTGAAALALVATDPPDVVLMDLQMTG